MLLTTIQTDWESPMTEEELKILREYANQNRKITHSYVCK